MNFHFPDHGVSIEAPTLEEAEKKLASALKETRVESKPRKKRDLPA